MNTDSEILAISDFKIEVVRKPIKNMHLAVYPPTGRIRLATPTHTHPEVIRFFAISKIGWMRKHAKRYKEQIRESPRKFVSGETHYLFGKKILLKVVQTENHYSVKLEGHKKLVIKTPKSATIETKKKQINEWHRKHLKKEVAQKIALWEAAIGVKVSNWRIQRMRTKWGSCNPKSKSITLNLELAKKPKACIEYIVVHELMHLIEKSHNERFISLLDKHLPKWRFRRKELNELPVGHEDWEY